MRYIGRNYIGDVVAFYIDKEEEDGDYVFYISAMVQDGFRARLIKAENYNTVQEILNRIKYSCILINPDISIFESEIIENMEELVNIVPFVW